MYIGRNIDQRLKLIYRLSALSILLISLIAINAGCTKDDTSTNTSGDTQGSNEIIIQGLAFSPASKTVPVGTTIKWTNKENITHTVTSGVPGSPSGLFDSGNLGVNGVFSFTFSQAGTFKYYCKIHPSMTATIVVQ
jgi:plastocyanin